MNLFESFYAKCPRVILQLEVSLSRRRRLPKPERRINALGQLHRIRIIGGAEFDCGQDEPVLIAMERCGADDIGVGCRGGGCGICRIRVVNGDYKTGKMSAERVSQADREAGFALACRLFPTGDLLIAV